MTATTESWSEIALRRAEIYAWFAGIFATELSEDAISCYRQHQVDFLFAALSQAGFGAEIDALKASIAAWGEDNRSTKIDLAADFASLFLLDGRASALPYASYYLDKDHQLFGKEDGRMREFLQKNHLTLHPNFKEPSDHLAVALAVMSHWCQEAAHRDAHQEAALQQAFLQDALASWLPQWLAKMQSIGHTSSQFYQTAAALMLAFINEDMAYLIEESTQA